MDVNVFFSSLFRTHTHALRDSRRERYLRRLGQEYKQRRLSPLCLVGVNERTYQAWEYGAVSFGGKSE